MTFKFSEGLPLVVPEENIIDHCFDHLTAVAKRDISPGELCSPNCVAIDPATNYIYIAEGGYSYFARVCIFSLSGEFLNSYTHEDMTSLYGIAICGNNLYLTDWRIHAVFHLKIEANLRLVARLGSRGSGIGQFDYPHQLSTSTVGDVYIADTNNNRIQILDSSLHPIREISHPSMHRPCDVKLTAEEIYVLSSVDSSCVHVFAHTGHKLRSLITRRMRQAIESSFFCLDIRTNLIIYDRSAEQIIIFSNKGVLLHTFGEHGMQAGMFCNTKGFCLTSDLNLVIVSWHDNCLLQIFS